MAKRKKTVRETTTTAAGKTRAVVTKKKAASRKKKIAAKARWDQLGKVEEAVTEIAANMAKLCKNSDTWLQNHHRNVNSLWGRLAANVLDENGSRDRFWLHTIFAKDRNGLQTVFRKLAGEEKVPIPLATSTPKKKERICICQKDWDEADPDVTKCNGCNNLFHVLCLLQSKRQDPGSGFICPVCKRENRKESSIFVPVVLVDGGSTPDAPVSLLSMSAFSAGSQETAQTFNSGPAAVDQPSVLIGDMNNYSTDNPAHCSIPNNVFDAPDECKSFPRAHSSVGPECHIPHRNGSPPEAVALDLRISKGVKPQVQEAGRKDAGGINSEGVSRAVPVMHHTPTKESALYALRSSSELSEPRKPSSSANSSIRSTKSGSVSKDSITSCRQARSPYEEMEIEGCASPHRAHSVSPESDPEWSGCVYSSVSNHGSDDSAKGSPRPPTGIRLSLSPMYYKPGPSTVKRTGAVKGESWRTMQTDKSEAHVPDRVVKFGRSEEGLSAKKSPSPAPARSKAPSPVSKLRRNDHKKQLHEKPGDLLEEFTLELTMDEWRPLLLTARNRSLPEGWTDLIKREFKRFQPYCDLGLKCHKLNRDSTKSYFSATGYCRFKGCYTFKFKAPKPPKDHRPMAVHVSSMGLFHHEEGEFKYPQIRSLERQRLAKKLRLQTPTQVANKYYAKAQSKAMNVGNMSSLQEKQIFRQIRYEEKLSNDFDAEPMVDLYMMFISERRRDRESWFIRQLSIVNFRLILFSNSQLEALNELRNLQNGNLVAHFDATGSLVNVLPKEIEGTTKIFSYVISVSSPKTNGAPLTVLEFILNKHDGDTIQRCLEYFNEEAKSALKISGPLFSRIEVDHSGALIYASIGAFHGMDRKSYLWKCWRVLFCGEKPVKPNLHICRRHAWCSINKQKVEMYKLPVTSPKAPLDGVIIAYLKSSNFGSSFRRALQLLTICGIKYRTESVIRAIAEVKARTTAEFIRQNESTWLNFDVSKLDNSTIWKGTPFGALFNAEYDRMQKELENVHSFELDKNEFYNKAFTDYLLKKIFPQTPLMTHCSFGSIKDNLQEDTQAAVENTFRGIKIDENARQGPNKIGRYVRMRKETLKGTTKKFLGDVIWARTSKLGPQRSRNMKVAAKSQTIRQKSKQVVQKRKRAHNRTAIPTERWKSHKPKNIGPTTDATAWLDLPGIEFIPWGTLATDKSKYKFKNTCPIDNTMMVFQILYQKYPLARKYFDESKDKVAVRLRQVLHTVSEKRFNDAKTMWMQHIAKDNNYILDRNEINCLWGAEDLRALNPIMSIFQGQFYEIVTCQNNAHGAYKMVEMKMASYVVPTVQEAVKKINSPSPRERCTHSNCNAGIHRDVYADAGLVPPFLFIQLAAIDQNLQDKIEDLPQQIQLADQRFELVACNLATNERHFVLAIWETGQFVTYNGMQKQRKYKSGVPAYNCVTTAWYCRTESSDA